MKKELRKYFLRKLPISPFSGSLNDPRSKGLQVAIYKKNSKLYLCYSAEECRTAKDNARLHDETETFTSWPNQKWKGVTYPDIKLHDLLRP